MSTATDKTGARRRMSLWGFVLLGLALLPLRGEQKYPDFNHSLDVVIACCAGKLIFERKP